MKKITKKLTFLACSLVLAFPVSASAATMKAVNQDFNIVSNYVKLSQSQLSNEEGITIQLNENEPVQVQYPDGSVETLTYQIENVVNPKSRKISQIARATRGIRTASLELWGYATWEDRSVSFDDEVYLDYWGVGTSVEEDNTWISQRTGTNNTYAKARTRGDCTTTEPATGVEYSSSFDFELWLDPADSSRAFMHINK